MLWTEKTNKMGEIICDSLPVCIAQTDEPTQIIKTKYSIVTMTKFKCIIFLRNHRSKVLLVDILYHFNANMTYYFPKTQA